MVFTRDAIPNVRPFSRRGSAHHFQRELHAAVVHNLVEVLPPKDRAMISGAEMSKLSHEIAMAWHAGDTAAATQKIDDVLQRGSDMQCAHALLFRGHLKEDEGDWLNAARDFSEAARLADSGSYRAYVAQINAAGNFDRAGERDSAIRHYLAALHTCAASAEPISAGATLNDFLRLNAAPGADDLAIVHSAIEASWRALRLPGSPPLHDVAGCVQTIVAKEVDASR